MKQQSTRYQQSYPALQSKSLSCFYVRTEHLRNQKSGRNGILYAAVQFCNDRNGKEGPPQATHLPFLTSERNGNLFLSSHFALANEQWKDLESGLPLIIFSEPHAYISPAHYEKEQNVPTWNYVAIHAYGKASLIREESEIEKLLEASISAFEPGYLEQWSNLAPAYRSRLMNGIVGFEIKVTDLQGKAKTSQNRALAEKKNIISSLGKSSDTNARWIGEYMERQLSTDSRA